MDGGIVCLQRFGSHAVDVDGERAEVSQLDALSGQQLLAHAVHRLDQHRLDVGTVVFGAVVRDMFGKLLQCHDFGVLGVGVCLLGGILVTGVGTEGDTVVDHRFWGFKGLLLSEKCREEQGAHCCNIR